MDNVRTIDITPTWTEILPLLIALVKSPKTQKIAEADLAKMAQAADNWNEHVKSLKE